ncbi:Ctr copper transporter family-domain-containing protein [Tuber borchii]|uniref:Copper transport protein n=1 Tax=Tuber borchii TaxID=42251 RepID=A0A2T7A480_TUBBO|nr:Ctr copper transporter family-domain-containing protein [Tuber borchii]
MYASSSLRLLYSTPLQYQLTKQTPRLFTWSTQDLCLVFRSWHVRNTTHLILSLLAVIALSAGYEFVRNLARRYEARVDGAQSISEETSSLLPGRADTVTGEVERRRRNGRIGKAVFYGVQVFYSFFIMLLFMTYNGWVMISVAVGSAIGYVIWGGSGAAKSVACH